MYLFTAANSYKLSDMIGKVVVSSKKSAPIYSITGRQTTGAFSEDLAKVFTCLLLIYIVRKLVDDIRGDNSLHQ